MFELIINNGSCFVNGSLHKKDIAISGGKIIKIESSIKDDAKEVKEGLECGIGVDGVKKFIEGDIIEVYEIREVKRKLELN